MPNEGQGSGSPPATSRRLESWKEIAAHLNRTVRTVQRWEREQGLPVHRLHHNRLASVYAFEHELNDWWDQRRVALATDDTTSESDTTAGTPLVAVQSGGSERQQPVKGRRKWAAMGVGLAVALIAVAIVAAVSGLGRPRFEGVSIKSVAVLPLAVEGDSTEQYLADGVADELARQIARVRHVRVVARQPSSRVPGGLADVRELARRLEVDAVLLGTLVESASTIRIDARLVLARSGREIWRGKHEGLRGDHRSRGAAVMLARDLFAQIWPDERPPDSAPRSSDAYLAYLRGRYNLAKRTPDGLRAARSQFDEAVRLDSRYAEAHAGLADAWLLMGIFGVADRRDALTRAKAAADHAIELENDSAEAHTSLAFASELLDHKWIEAESHFKRAIELNPSYVPAHHWYALMLDSTLRGPEAIREMETALALDPFSTVLGSDLGMVLYHQKQFERAIAQFTKVLALDPTYADAYKELGQTYMYSGRYQLAMNSFQRAEELGASPREIGLSRVIAYARAGQINQARETIDSLNLPPNDPANAAAWLAVGEYNRALDLLVRVYAGGDDLLVGPLWDPVRRDPRFHELLRRSGFTELGIQ